MPRSRETARPWALDWVFYSLRRRPWYWVRWAVFAVVIGVFVIYPVAGLWGTALLAVAEVDLLLWSAGSRGVYNLTGKLAPVGPWEARTERIHLRHPTRDDLPGLRASLDDEVKRANGLTDRHTRIMELVARYPAVARDTGEFVAITLDDGAVAGSSSVHSVDWSQRSAEVGLWIAPTHRGRGLAQDVLRATTAVAWDMRFVRVTIKTDWENHWMRRTCERAGAVPVPGSVEHTLPDGRETRAVSYEFLAPPPWSTPDRAPGPTR